MTRVVGLLAFVLRYELAIYRSLWRWVTRRPAIPAGAEAHSYVGAVSALLWAFIGVSLVELVALHLILPWERVRLVADILGVWGLVWMLGFAAMQHVHPHLVTDRALVVRSGHSFAIEVPWTTVASVSVRERSRESSRGVQVDEAAAGETRETGEAGDIVNVVMASRTNVDVRLRTPVELPVQGVVRRIAEVRLFADDPRALARACRGRLDAAASA